MQAAEPSRCERFRELQPYLSPYLKQKKTEIFFWGGLGGVPVMQTLCIRRKDVGL